MTRGRVVASRYELDLPLGRGGMGEVWSAYDQRLDRLVAVKLLRKDLFPIGAPGQDAAALPTRARQIRDRFVREARSTARIEHPGVPAVYDAGADQGELYLVMQLIAGVGLADLLAEGGAMEVGQAAAIGAQIASILSVAHAVSLVHRDLKPLNVVVTDAGEVKVLDFGIAAVLEPDITRLTAADETLGSPAYMAPEQVLHAQVSPRTDLYALGCVLHEMLTGEQVFAGRTSYALMHAHIDRPPPSLKDLRADTPSALCVLVDDLLAKDPADRPADAAQVYERLIGHVPMAKGATTPAGAPDSTRPFREPLAPLSGPATARAGRGDGSPTGAGAGRLPPPAPADVSPVGSTSGEHVDLAAVQHEALDLIDAGRFTQASDALSRALAAEERDHPGSADELDLRLLLANTLSMGEDFVAALPHYERVLTRPDLDEELAISCRVQVAACLAAIGRTTAALDQLIALSRLQGERLGAAHPDSVDVRRQIIMLTASSGDVGGAIGRLEELIEEVSSTSRAGADVGELQLLLEHLRRLDGGS